MLALYLFIILNVAQCAEYSVQEEIFKDKRVVRLTQYLVRDLSHLWNDQKGECSSEAHSKFALMLWCLCSRRNSPSFTSLQERNKTSLLGAMLHCMARDRRYSSLQDSEDTLRFDLSKYNYSHDGSSRLFEGTVKSSDPEQVLFSSDHMKNAILVSEHPSSETCAEVRDKYKKRLLYVDCSLEDLDALGRSLMDQIVD
ncbi:MAG: hypothetical protein OXC30_02940 [Alphaproteobacteria bacterium]|nr:hypothetical protein [Alphaproteobacteria bacterium]